MAADPNGRGFIGPRRATNRDRQRLEHERIRAASAQVGVRPCSVVEVAAALAAPKKEPPAAPQARPIAKRPGGDGNLF